MDENSKDVLVSAVTVLGTLGGIWLGWLLQNRRRHDDEKRRVYGHFVGLVRQEMSHHMRAHAAERVEGVTLGYISEAAETVALAQILSSRKVGEGCRQLHNAVIDWVTDQPYDDATWRTNLAGMRSKIDVFIALTKGELHI